ncbi:MAG: hypothetical protein ABWZ80_07345 [Beijerinckiaceae bacterium]
MRLVRNPLPSTESCTDLAAIDCHGAALQTAYRIDPTPSGWLIVRLSDDGLIDECDVVLHRLREVAEARAAAGVALEAYLASIDRREDASDLFEEWRSLDDRYEFLLLDRKDSPAFVAANAAGGCRSASGLRH